MAVDTRNKRFSMMGLLQPVPALLPDPDNSIDTQDRSMFRHLYYGLSLGIPLVVTPLTFGVFAYIDPHGQGVTANISADGKGVLATISQSMGVFARISEGGQGVEGVIDGNGKGVTGDMT